jgi:hypothetical protein
MAFSLVRASSVEPKAPREDAILARMEGDENRSPAAAQLPRSERNAMAAGCELARHPHFATARAHRLARGRKITHTRSSKRLEGQGQCGGFEVPVVIVAIPFRNFKSKGRTRITRFAQDTGS